jgi:hypothetical protein
VQLAGAAPSTAVAEAEAEVAELCSDPPVEAVSVAASSIPAGLISEAEKADAAMIVVGSGSDGSWGTVVVSSTADRILHSSPVPVAVATRGYRTPPNATGTRATCAFRGDASSRAAEQEEAVAALGDAAPESVEMTVATGRSWPEALEALDWDRGDELVWARPRTVSPCGCSWDPTRPRPCGSHPCR